jgi:preprotein translocase subunit SecD
MKPRTVTAFALAGVVAMALLGFGAWLLLRQKPPKMDDVGGTVLVYEVDTSDADVQAHYSPQDMADAVLRRLDPKGARGITVRPVEGNRVEIGLPKGAKQAEDLQHLKDLLRQVGKLEFRILANTQDDQEGIEAAKEYIRRAAAGGGADQAMAREQMTAAAIRGQPPVMPSGPEDGAYPSRKGKFKYAWVEVSRQQRKSLGLDNAAESDPGPSGEQWRRVAKDRADGNCTLLAEPYGMILLYSRDCQNLRLAAADRTAKKYEYFLLTRLAPTGEDLTGAYLSSVQPGIDSREQYCVNLRFSPRGGDLLHDLSSLNGPTGDFHRLLAVILDGEIMTAPRLVSAIREHGQISGNFSKVEVDQLVDILRSGALPAPLKPLPVSETALEPKK